MCSGGRTEFISVRYRGVGCERLEDRNGGTGYDVIFVRRHNGVVSCGGWDASNHKMACLVG